MGRKTNASANPKQKQRHNDGSIRNTRLLVAFVLVAFAYIALPHMVSASKGWFSSEPETPTQRWRTLLNAALYEPLSDPFKPYGEQHTMLVAATLRLSQSELEPLINETKWHQMPPRALDLFLLACAIVGGADGKAARMVAVQMKPSKGNAVLDEVAAVQAERLMLLRSKAEPTSLFSQVDEVSPGDLDYKLFAARYAKPRKAVVVKNWLAQHPEMEATFTWTTLPHLCYTTPIPTAVFSEDAVADGAWAGMWGTSPMPLTDYMIAVLSGNADSDQGTRLIFDQSIRWYCKRALEHFMVPFMAANDLFAHARVMEQAYDGPEMEQPSLFVQPKDTQCGLHIDTGHSHYLQVLHQGRKRWTIYPLDYPDQADFMSADPIAINTQDEYGTHATLEYGMPYLRNLNQRRFAPRSAWGKGLFALAHARRIEIVTSPGDLIFIPAGIPHFAEVLEDSIATSLNWVDASNAQGYLPKTDTQSWIGKVRKLAQKPPAHNKDMPYTLWKKLRL